MTVRFVSLLLHAPLMFLIASNAQAQEPRPAPDRPEIPIEAYRLPNGLRVVLSPDETVPRVTVCVAYHVGSKNERAGRTGFAHFFEHMMFRGTENVPDYDIPLEEAGSVTNAFTSEDMTIYFETVPSNYLERALYMEAERLAFLPSNLDQEKFDTEREIVKNERRQSYENVPYGLAQETILARLFPEGHPYSWSVIGSMADLDRSDLDDLKQFFGEFYHPGNAVLALVGDFDSGEAKALIEKYFGPLKPGPDPRRPESPEVPPVADRIELADRVQLPRVYWAWPTVAEDHPDAPALDLLAAILADGEASRLYQALVREERVSSDVDASSDTKEIDGLFLIQSTTGEGRPVEEVEAILTREIARLRAVAPTAEEFDRALAKFESAFYTTPYFGLVSPLGRAVSLATGYAQKDDPEYFLRRLGRLFEVDRHDVRRVADEYLTAERKLVLVVRPMEPGEGQSPAVLAGPLPSDTPGPEFDPSSRAPDPDGPDWSALPDPDEPRPFQAPEFVRRELSSGLDVWIAPWRTLPIASVVFQLPGGTADDPEGKSGLANLAASLLDKGTEDLSATELAEAFEALGVQPGVGSGLDTTTIGFSALTRNLDPALSLVGQMLSAPRLDPTEFDRERQLQLIDLIQGPDEPRWIAQRAFRALLYGQDHPYGNPPDGTIETVKELTIEDVRAFFERYFKPQGARLIVVGDVEPDALIKSLEEVLDDWQGQAPQDRSRPGPTASADPGVVYLVDKPGAEQSILSVGRRSFDRNDPRHDPALLGNRIFGGDFLSRLNQNLRVRSGFTYGASSGFSFRKGESVWIVSTAVRGDATAPALREVFNELEALVRGTNPFSVEEIATARDAEMRSYPETFQSPGGIASILAEMAEYDLPADYLDTFLDRLEAAQNEEVSRTLVEVVSPEALVTLVVGDRATVEPELKRLGFQDVRIVTIDGQPAD
ncbi:pitrilysin family protein [soil metagenome]